jgi:hypothetical protein
VASGRVGGRFVAGGAALVVLAALAWLVVLPSLVRRRCVAAAASRGLVLSVGGVRLGFEHFALLDVEVSSAELAGMSAKGAELDVTLSGLVPAAATATRWDIALDGRDVADTLTTWRAAHVAGGDGVTIHMDDAHVTWTHAFGAAARVDALGLVADISADGASSHAVTPHVVVATPRGDLGPWRTTLDRAAETVTIRVAFDPASPSGAHLDVVTARDVVESLELSIPRSTFPKLGIPARSLGLPVGDATQMAVTASMRRGEKTEVSVDAALFALKVASVPRPLDATLKLSATAPGDGVSDVDRDSSASIGPLRGAVTGTLTSLDGGARLELKWTGGPVPCAALGAIESPPSPPGSTPTLGDLANELGKLAQATGIAKVSGEIGMHAALVVDARNLSATELSFTPTSTCEVALFGAP